MFANQAAASAILDRHPSPPRHGWRAGDRRDHRRRSRVRARRRSVPGASADAAPRRGARRCCGSSRARLTRRRRSPRDRQATPEAAWTLRASHVIHRQLAQLAAARSTATANVKVAPRRWPLRSAVLAETERIAQLDLLANAVLGLVRAAGSDIYGTRPLPDSGPKPCSPSSTDAIRRLAATPQPWPPECDRDVVERRVEEVCRGDGSAISDRGTIVASRCSAPPPMISPSVIDQIHTGTEKRERRSL